MNYYKTVILSEVARAVCELRSRRACPERSRRNPEDFYVTPAEGIFLTMRLRREAARSLVEKVQTA
jgi:hypothetical protein